MLQKRRRKRRRHKRSSLKRKLITRSGLALIAVMAGGAVFLLIYGMENVCGFVSAKQENREIALFSDAPSKDSEVDGKGEPEKAVDVIHLLVNKSFCLPEGYEVPLTTLKNGRQQVASVIYEDLKEMLSDGTDAGLSFLVASGFRSSEKQEQLLEEEIEKNRLDGMDESEARADALLTVAPAFYSEHETGLAVDIVAVSNQRLDETQEYTPENIWLRENCYKYGFILRYPRGKEDITGFSYESWHFRYVGKEAAEEITEQGITLEEYLEKL